MLAAGTGLTRHVATGYLTCMYKAEEKLIEGYSTSISVGTSLTRLGRGGFSISPKVAYGRSGHE